MSDESAAPHCSVSVFRQLYFGASGQKPAGSRRHSVFHQQRKPAVRPHFGRSAFARAQQDLTAAQELLHSSQVFMHALPVTEADATISRCPRCQHTDIVCRQQPQPSDSLFTKLRLWILAPEKPQCHCFQCGAGFRG